MILKLLELIEEDKMDEFTAVFNECSVDLSRAELSLIHEKLELKVTRLRLINRELREKLEEYKERKRNEY